MRLRPLVAEDRDLLAEATLGNVNWDVPRFSKADLWTTPEVRRYIEPWRAGDDFGFVAHDAQDRTAGVVWLKQFRTEEPGYGFVTAGIPELSVHVWPGHRGRGIGGRLIEAAITEARARGLDGISLSVAAGNPARRLYERLGFAAPDVCDNPETMLLRL